jgi:hypothetical protein
VPLADGVPNTEKKYRPGSRENCPPFSMARRTVSRLMMAVVVV